MSNDAKLNSLKDQLKSKLSMRLSPLSYTVTESSDSVGPILIIKDGSSNIKAVLRYKSMSNAFKDVIGQSVSSYSPSIVQVVELGTATVSQVILNVKNALDWELARQGVMAERYTDASPAAGLFSADGSCSATNAFSNLSDLNWPLSGQ